MDTDNAYGADHSAVSKNKQLLNRDAIIYIIMNGNYAEVHSMDGDIRLRVTLKALEEELGADFIKIHRGCLVSIKAIHTITDMVNLNNGEVLEYPLRKKRALLAQLNQRRKYIIDHFDSPDVPDTEEDYRRYYISMEKLPFAFADIEMVFDESKNAVDWIFRYGNPALARLEKLPLQQLLGSSFGSLFSNMDSKWLRAYERVALYGETLEIMDYSPEIDTDLKIICFPTFKGHCGCVLFNAEQINLISGSSDYVLMNYMRSKKIKNVDSSHR